MVMKSKKGAISIGMIIVLGIIAYALLQQKGFQWQQSYGQPYVVLQPITETADYFVSISVTPNDVCIGEQITGTITSNMPFGRCSAYVNNNFMTNANLDASGSFSYSNSIGVAGSAIIKVMCCDNQNRCRTSNEVMLTVRNCATTTIPTGKYYCCFAMGQFACFENNCPPAGQKISGPFDTMSNCNSVCNAQATSTVATTTSTKTTIFAGGSICCYSKKTGYYCTSTKCGLFETYIGNFKLPEVCKQECHATTTTQTTAATTSVTTTVDTCPTWCVNNGYQAGINFAATGYSCYPYASQQCSPYTLSHSMDNGQCCCWKCNLPTTTTVDPCIAWCMNAGYDSGINFAATNWYCVGWVKNNICSSPKTTMDNGQCCCWKC